MKRNTIQSDLFSESFVRGQTDQGLDVWFMPRKGFTKKIGILAINFGSIHDRFTVDGEKDTLTVPAGTAHFLEHRRFETDRGDAFDLFERLGASSNAGTGHVNTTYFFTCTENFYRSLEILLSFAGPLLLTDEMVQRERKIVIQEVLSYADSPDSRGYQTLLRSLYPNHPVRNDISGSVESVNAITRSDLDTCRELFYVPANAQLVVSGDLEEDELFSFVTKNCPDRGCRGTPRIDLPAETGGVGEPSTVLRMHVPRPRMFLGFREDTPSMTGMDLLKNNLAANLLFYVLFGTSSDFYRRFYREGLIDDTFSASLRGETEFTYSLFNAETAQPEKLRDEIFSTLAIAKRDGLDAEDIARGTRKMKGRFFKTFNSPESSAFSLQAYASKGLSLFDFKTALDDVTAEAVHARLLAHFEADLHCMCTVVPD